MAVPGLRPFFRGHCGLCRLAYVPGDVVYFGESTPNGPLLPISDDLSHKLVTITEHTEMAYYHGARYAFHYSCCCLVTSREAEDVASLFECSERVHRLHERRRIEWALQRLAENPSRGPRSASSNTVVISRHYIREFLTTNAIRLLREPPVPDSIVSFSRPIYYTTADVEGRTYVVSLTNLPTAETRPLTVLVPEICPRSVVYVEHDSFGVLSVVIGSCSNRPLVAAHRTRSWTSFEVSNFEQLVGRTNRAVIKKIFCTSNSMMHCLYQGDLSWAFPVPPSLTLRAQLLRAHAIAPRFHFIPLNAPGIFGYSVCWHGGLVSLFAHTSLDDMPDYDRPHDTWFFLPVDSPRERISKIWKRESTTASGGAVAVETNSDRLMVWGPYPEEGGRSSGSDREAWRNDGERWELIHHADDQPSRIHYEDSDFIRAFAFEGPAPRSEGGQLVIPPRPAPTHQRILPETFYYNEAELHGVHTVIPCKVGGAYTGIVLLYRNGRKGAVGAVRLDRLRRPIPLNNNSDLWFHTSYDSGMYPYISSIGTHELRSRFPQLHVSGTGRLGWWWSKNQTRVTFKTRRSSEVYPLLDSPKGVSYQSISAAPHSPDIQPTHSYTDKPIAPEHLKLLAMTMHTGETPGESSKDGASREETASKGQGSSKQEGSSEENNKGKGVDPAVAESIIDARVRLRVNAVLMARYSTRSRTSTAPGNVMRPTGSYLFTARERNRLERERELERERALAANANASGVGNDGRVGEGSGARRREDEDSDAEDQRLMREALQGHGTRDYYDQIYRMRLPRAEARNGSARSDPAIGATIEEDGTGDNPTTRPARPEPVSSSQFGRVTTVRVTRDGPTVEVGNTSRDGSSSNPITVPASPFRAETRNGTATETATTTAMRDAPAARAGITSRTGTAYDPIERSRKHSRTGEGDDTPAVARDTPAVHEVYDPIERPRKRSRNEESNGTVAATRDMATQLPGNTVAVSRNPLSRTPMVEAFSDSVSASRGSMRIPPWARNPMVRERNSAPAADGSSGTATTGSTARFTDQGRTVPREGTTRPAQRGNRSSSPHVRFRNQGNGNWDYGNKSFDGME